MAEAEAKNYRRRIIIRRDCFLPINEGQGECSQSMQKKILGWVLNKHSSKRANYDRSVT